MREQGRGFASELLSTSELKSMICVDKVIEYTVTLLSPPVSITTRAKTCNCRFIKAQMSLLNVQNRSTLSQSGTLADCRDMCVRSRADVSKQSKFKVSRLQEDSS